MDLLPVVVLEEELQKKPRRNGRRLLKGLLQRCPDMLRQALPLLPWLLCLGACFGRRREEAQTGLLGVALLATSLAFSCGSVAGFADLKVFMLAMLFWNGPRPVGDRWCRAALKDGGDVQLGQHAALGLVLLDDLLRAVLHFLASEPAEAWPFALTCRGLYQLSHDEEWWERCYNYMAWQRLPTAEPWPLPSPRRLLREALLLASMMAETVGMMVLLQPPTIGWAAAPCIASTLLVVSSSPWLPRQSGLVLVEMSRLLSLICRFAVQAQALLLLLAAAVQPHLPLPCRRISDSVALKSLETIALAVMYSMVACRLIANMARCRAASPLYAVPAEEVVAEPVPHNHSKPLYCDGGVVEGTYAPTRICAWEELSGISSRRRYILRRCGDLLVAREAHLLSHLDALQWRINEAENEQTYPPKEQFTGLPVLLVPGLCLLCADSLGTVTGQPWCLQALVWLLILSRFGRGWYQEVLRNFPYQADEVWQLRREFCTAHQHLAETHQLISQLEDHVQQLGAPKSLPRHRDLAAFGVTLLAWFGCCGLILVWLQL